MKYTFPFEKLEVWQLSKTLAIKTYIDTESFPDREKYGIIDQMRRSAISISSNMAEGNSRKNAKERMRFFNISFSSLMEFMSQAIIANELNFLAEEQYYAYRSSVSEISNKLIALMNNQLEYYK